jgi:hypothetical protein
MVMAVAAEAGKKISLMLEEPHITELVQYRGRDYRAILICHCCQEPP